MRQLDHSRIIKVHDYFQDEDSERLVLVLYFAENGTLFDLIENLGSQRINPD